MKNHVRIVTTYAFEYDIDDIEKLVEEDARKRVLNMCTPIGDMKLDLDNRNWRCDIVAKVTIYQVVE